jgi:hypothetical protein
MLSSDLISGREKNKRHVTVGVESTFSNSKRFFDEFVIAQNFEKMVKEITLKTFCFNVLINLSSLKWRVVKGLENNKKVFGNLLHFYTKIQRQVLFLFVKRK